MKIGINIVGLQFLLFASSAKASEPHPGAVPPTPTRKQVRQCDRWQRELLDEPDAGASALCREPIVVHGAHETGFLPNGYPVLVIGRLVQVVPGSELTKEFSDELACPEVRPAGTELTYTATAWASGPDAWLDYGNPMLRIWVETPPDDRRWQKAMEHRVHVRGRVWTHNTSLCTPPSLTDTELVLIEPTTMEEAQR